MKYSKFFLPIPLLIVGLSFFFIKPNKITLIEVPTNNVIDLEIESRYKSSKDIIARVNYSEVPNKIATLSTAPSGHTLVSSNIEYLFDDLGPILQPMDF